VKLRFFAILLALLVTAQASSACSIIRPDGVVMDVRQLVEEPGLVRISVVDRNFDKIDEIGYAYFNAMTLDLEENSDLEAVSSSTLVLNHTSEYSASHPVQESYEYGDIIDITVANTDQTYNETFSVTLSFMPYYFHVSEDLDRLYFIGSNILTYDLSSAELITNTTNDLPHMYGLWGDNGVIPAMIYNEEYHIVYYSNDGLCLDDAYVGYDESGMRYLLARGTGENAIFDARVELMTISNTISWDDDVNLHRFQVLNLTSHEVAGVTFTNQQLLDMIEEETSAKPLNLKIFTTIAALGLIFVISRKKFSR